MNTDNQIVLDCAFRYALGRMSYVSDAVSSVIIDCWDALPQERKNGYVRDIKKAIEENNIGMECDKACWQRILLLNEATNDASLGEQVK